MITRTRFGRNHVPESPSSLARMHLAGAAAAKIAAVSHPPRIPVLDQEDLIRQGINTSALVPGAPRVDALGSCVANATVTALSAGGPLEQVNGRLLAAGLPALAASAPGDEQCAILLYHELTDWTGDPADEWPPDDCGSSGLAACQYLEQESVISGSLIAHGAENVLSLMQSGPLITGQPWLNAWMEPGPDGFIDGDGSAEQLQADIAGGVAGGHETCWYAIESVGRGPGGEIDPQRTVIRFRNSWSASWNDHGDGLAHMSTFEMLARWCDWRMFTFPEG